MTSPDFVRITRKALSLAQGRGDHIQQIAIRAGYRQPEDEEMMLATISERGSLNDDATLAAVMWMMAEGWSDNKVLYKIAEDLGLGLEVVTSPATFWARSSPSLSGLATVVRG